MSKIFRKLIRPALFLFDAERAHEFGIEAVRLGLAGIFVQGNTNHGESDQFLNLERFGLKFDNPLGIAAGFDKNAVVVNQLAALGFGFVEVGTVTFEPQKGNEKPRLFRLPKDHALINRLGFNNEGARKIAERLKNIDRKCVVGVNIGKNKDVPNEEATGNYLKSLDLIHSVADYIAVNISSPNTPNLRELQNSENLEDLLGALQNRNQELGAKPLLVKIAPDLTEAEIEMIVDTCLRLKVSGIIATNTTISRDDLKTANAAEFGSGGLSGKPLASRSIEVIRTIYRHSKGRLPIIGVGGIFSGKDAFEKIAAGACLLQAYTGFVYHGPSFAQDINAALTALIKERGFSNIDQVIGSGVR
ncbi:MAG: quinone-dependent dihydroorotate dehydrogenase [Pyrinomonadaceae bacterium]